MALLSPSFLWVGQPYVHTQPHYPGSAARCTRISAPLTLHGAVLNVGITFCYLCTFVELSSPICLYSSALLLLLFPRMGQSCGQVPQHFSNFTLAPGEGDACACAAQQVHEASPCYTC